eukprot:TRINITY_DN21695_c0_g1_i6.p1 TRINITY_DN21695_c0_g1~~TRINITY_DN21695_c0_g1_i6.p1  ORF type:complete len:350 (+),score=24.21 TRINITY_DN21695_c0_g1_i6:146-1195(+)
MESEGEDGRRSLCLQVFQAPLRSWHLQHHHQYQQQQSSDAELCQSAPSFSSKHAAPKLEFGKTLHRLGDHVGSEPKFCWCAADPLSFRVRSQDYMKTKKKEPSQGQIYELVGVDLFSFEKKMFHIAKHIELPNDLTSRKSPDKILPPLLIINILLPVYPAILFGEKDGKGHSLVYYFTLRKDFDADQVQNEAAVKLLRKFFAGEHGHHFRDRLKLIPRISNVDEWAKRGPLSTPELSLIRRYNGKPILTRPAHKFYRGQNYFEIDLDIHVYPFVARKAFQGYVGKLGGVVFENAFVVQGNSREELPELLLGCTKVFRVDFQKLYPLPVVKHSDPQVVQIQEKYDDEYDV